MQVARSKLRETVCLGVLLLLSASVDAESSIDVDAIAMAAPQFVHEVRVVHDDQGIMIKGYVVDSDDLTRYMRHLNEYYGMPELLTVDAVEKKHHFVIKISKLNDT